MVPTIAFSSLDRLYHQNLLKHMYRNISPVDLQKGRDQTAIEGFRRRLNDFVSPMLLPLLDAQSLCFNVNFPTFELGSLSAQSMCECDPFLQAGPYPKLRLS